MAGLVLAGGLTAIYWISRDAGVLGFLADAGRLRSWIEGFGAVGPLVVVAAMTFAIVFTPVPSAPIALAAGAIYGHAWGTLYVLTGAELGALIAFTLSRLMGYQVLRHWLGDRLEIGLLGSQNALMGIVFASRLMPFVSFDLVSYAAGITPLSAWRFALATLAGILPASFLLAHFGAELATADPTRMLVSGLAIGGIVAIPLAWRIVSGRGKP